MNMWKKDSTIDSLDLDTASLETPSLHAKYLEFYTIAKLDLKGQTLLQEKLKKDKWLYFSGKMSKTEMDNRDWPYDPFEGGAKPLKTDMAYYTLSDDDLQKMSALVEYKQQLADLLKEIMENLKWRHQTIRNAISWRQFTAGG